jgi:L-threonylcarbamoyladenylate synthase
MMFRVTQNHLSNNSFILVPPDTHNIMRAVELLHQGALVAFPTETVYGLGGAAENNHAVAEIYRTKGRPSHNPLIVHVADMSMAERYGVFNGLARTLAEAFFPAALTLVVPALANAVAPSVLAGGNTVALRCPAHAVAQSLLHAFGAGIAAPSANRSGRISPTNAAHVAAEFIGHSGALRLILDGGACAIGLESTVVDCRK